MVLSKFANDKSYKYKLEQKAISLARKTLKKSIDEESCEIKFPMAFEDCELILTELDEGFERSAYSMIDNQKHNAHKKKRESLCETTRRTSSVSPQTSFIY